MKSLYIAIFGVCSILPAFAQQKEDSVKLTRELTLEKEYNPTVRDAFKINTLPEVKEPEAPKAEIEFSNYTNPYDVKPEIPLLKAGSYFTELDKSKKRGYISGGVGSFVDVDADFGYQVLNSETDKLNIWGSHRSSNGNVKYLQDGLRQKMKINDNNVAISYSNQGEAFKFFIDGAYTYSGFNYYGYSLPSVSSLPEMLNKNTNQVNNIFNVGLGFLSNKPTEELNYSLKVDYSYLGEKYAMDINTSGPKENSYRIQAGIKKGLDSDKLIGFDGWLRGSSYKIDKRFSEYSVLYEDYDNISDIGLNPYMNFEGENWSARLGVLIDLLVNQKENINFAPDIDLNFYPTDHFLLYLNAKGGVDNNNMTNIFRENRYVMPFIRVRDSYSSFDGTVGMRSSFGTFSLDLFAGYKYALQEHFYVPTRLQMDNENMIGANYSGVKYYNGGVFKIGTNLKYQYAGLLDAGLKLVYYGWDVKDKDNADIPVSYKLHAWNKPSFESDLNVGVNVPSVPLRFDLMYHLEAGRKTLINNMVESMKNVNQLNLQATYSFSDSFSVYLRADNLLFQEYDMWYGYPAQGFNVMGGVSFKF